MKTVTDNLTTQDMWTILVGFLLPIVVALVNQTHWSKPLRAIVSFAICIVVAICDVLIQGNWNGHDLTRTLVLVAFVAYTSYTLFWKPSAIAPTIEAATSTNRPAVVRSP
jgi:uncharacterized membrane protein